MTARRDLVAERGKRGAVVCRGCGVELGRLNCNHTVFMLDPKAAAAFTILGTTRIELVCRSCGAGRYLKGDKLSRMGFQEKESA